MRLAQIKLAGFKSFVEPAAISLSHDLVGIVGPNGCGKSNLIDAVRWVLGESKASALRGDSMQDVIFSGSDHRKAVSRASVELIFDNHLNQISGQWSSYAEIAIKRVLLRDGQSSYYINNLHVRRRDVADLFLGTGVGGRGYAIIEQGMISRIIEAKPQELKSFLEEAAGISQYQERKHETSTRLAEAQKNLIRLEDIRQELETQLQQMEIQAQKAQRYRLLHEKLQIAQTMLWLQHKAAAIRKCHLAQQTILRLEAELEDVMLSQRDAEKKYEEIRTDETAINEKQLQIQGELYSVDAEIGHLELEISHLQKTKERITQQILQVDNQLQTHSQNKVKKVEALAYWQQEKSKAETVYQQCTINNNQESMALPAVEANFRNCQQKLNESRHNLLIIEQAKQLEENHQSYSDKNIQQLEARRTRLINEQNESERIDPWQLSELEAVSKQTENAFNERNSETQKAQNELSSAIKNKEQVALKIQELQQTISQASARFDALQNLQQKLENNQDLSAWLKKHQWHNLPRLWQKIQIATKWEVALEAVLREFLNSIEVEQLEKILDRLNEAPAGKWAIFEKKHTPLSGSRIPASSTANDCSRLLAHINTNQPEIQSALENWLQHVYVIENLQKGLMQRSSLVPGEILVTPQGHRITQHSVSFYAPDSQLHGVLSRQKEQVQLREKTVQLESQLQKQRQLMIQVNQQCNELDQTVHAASENSKCLQQEWHQLQLQLVKLTQIHERATYRNEQINQELHEIEHTLENELTLQKSANERYQKNLIQIENSKHIAQQAQLAWETSNEQFINQQQKLLQASKELQEATFYLQTCQNKIVEIENSLRTIDESLQQLNKEHAALQIEINEVDLLPLKAALDTALAKRRTIKEDAAQVRLVAENISSQLRQNGNARMASEQRSYTLRDEINQARLQEQAANITISQLDESIQETGVDTGQLTPLLEKQKTTAIQTDIQQLNAEITALGAVNLAALEELVIAQERESNLLIQIQDLNAAITTLDQAMQQIDRETQLRLQETLDLTNRHLCEIFPLIFSGGNARLEVCEDKIVDAGLMLMAQPPGKKNSSIHLLSGGEKALTALALIFSLFRLNPAPFCLLDEVDAPLDDSNTVRFCELVKKMAERTQFIFISHNKITMEMAQRLIGVTMQEQGISRIVAVDLADAINMGKRNKVTIN
ncbi:chromosome segregation protein SMC [Nitrosomonas sp.]|uniref:chromosome segregation protein SMC n=1 Tax=Nitrosomonas sp. TaxID=42353 RepID=UPI001DB32572|nr:chromosome segregation protein SMC [Nitrosomonas sp.]MBX3617801.1 chromosome segregation protein SMC [Nitrosomonas sp.]